MMFKPEVRSVGAYFLLIVRVNSHVGLFRVIRENCKNVTQVQHGNFLHKNFQKKFEKYKILQKIKQVYPISRSLKLIAPKSILQQRKLSH